MSEPQVRALAARLWDVFRAEYDVLFVSLFGVRENPYSKTFDELSSSSQDLWLRMAAESVAMLGAGKSGDC